MRGRLRGGSWDKEARAAEGPEPLETECTVDVDKARLVREAPKGGAEEDIWWKRQDETGGLYTGRPSLAQEEAE